MVPTNARHVTKMPMYAPKYLCHLFEERGCRVIKSNNVKWANVPNDIKLFVKLLPNRSSFHALNYSQICDALVLPRHLKQLGKQATTVFQVDNADSYRHMQLVVDNVCRLYNYPRSSFSVVDSSLKGVHKKTIVDFVQQDTSEFSVRLLAEQLRQSDQKGVKLSHVLHQFLDVLDWEEVFSEHGCSVMLQPGKPDTSSFNILEHILKRGFVHDPLLVEAPTFDATVNYPRNNFQSNCAYETYQYCVNIPDTSVGDALTRLTTYSAEDVDSIMQTHEKSPTENYGKKMVAKNLLAVNQSGGEELLPDCVNAASKLYNSFVKPGLEDMDSIEKVVHSIPIVYSERMLLADLCDQARLNIPEGQWCLFDAFIRQALHKGHLLCNGSQIELDHRFTAKDVEDGKSLLVLGRKRNKTAFIIRWTMNS
ncbi:tyrosine--tRNA ligase, mitochondrial-like isoform X1 [Watersipora subatra]|uniref:tyrosine--tRNA ligase, mitochondrial-like isoform X1 n=1 Tax=Watersipora subatra TaxID=2589382 RepID=UPI00355C68E8